MGVAPLAGIVALRRARGFAAGWNLLAEGVKEEGGLADSEGVAGVSNPKPRSFQTGYD